MTHEPFVVDLRRRNTEEGWLHRFDIFYTTVTPAWFTWLGWVAILSALQFVAETVPGNGWARTMWRLSVLLVTMYFCALFTRLRVIGIPKLTGHWLHVVSLLLGGGAAVIASLASFRIAEVLMATAR